MKNNYACSHAYKSTGCSERYVIISVWQCALHDKHRYNVTVLTYRRLMNCKRYDDPWRSADNFTLFCRQLSLTSWHARQTVIMRHKPFTCSPYFLSFLLFGFVFLSLFFVLSLASLYLRAPFTVLLPLSPILISNSSLHFTLPFFPSRQFFFLLFYYKLIFFVISFSLLPLLFFLFPFFLFLNFFIHITYFYHLVFLYLKCLNSQPLFYSFL